MKQRLFFALLFVFTFPLFSFSQKENLSDIWKAVWIQPTGIDAKMSGVCYYRKTFSLDSIPQQLIVHTSGDMRYQLYINEKMVTWGPLTGDIRHWYYESTDIAQQLQKGKNVIAVAVFNYGANPPDARLSIQTGFLLAADMKQNRFLNTDTTWKSIQSETFKENIVDKKQINGYYGGGSRDIFDANKHIHGWNLVAFDDKNWKNSAIIEKAFAKTCIWASRWKLTPRTLPHERITEHRFAKTFQAENIVLPQNFPIQRVDVTIPPNTKARFIIDAEKETTSYPILKISKGKNATIKITYNEAPVNSTDGKKGNRNDFTNKVFNGYFDKIIADGSNNLVYHPFWWRSFRFMVFEIETQSEALVINDIYGELSTYPFEKSYEFSAQIGNRKDTLVEKILEIGERTMLMCSHETFVDCPYYEESQFEGDTRIEALVSYLNFGDLRLGKNAIDQFS